MNKFSIFCFIYYIPIIMALAVIRMFGMDANNYLDYPLIFILGYVGSRMMFGNRTNIVVKTFTLFFFYCLFSGMLYLGNGVPFRCYFLTAPLLLIPMLFFYYGFRDKSTECRFEKMYIYACTFCFIAGFFLHIIRPSFYLSAIDRATANISQAVLAGRDVMDVIRFGSFFFNSYPIEFFSVPTLILSLYYINRKSISNSILYITAIASFVAAFMCMQRASVAGAIFVVFFYAFFLKEGKSKTALIFLFLASLLMVVVGNYVSGTEAYDTLSTQFDDLRERFDFSQAMDERRYQYEVFRRSTFFSNLFGLGLGSCGHQARFYGLQTINDNQFMLLYHELGAVGCFLLVIVIVKTMVKGFKSPKIYYPQLLIIGYFLLAFIGSEPLEVMAVSCIMWYSIGKIWNKDYYKRRMRETIKSN